MTKGLQEVGDGCYAYLQPFGQWGFSNAGLIVDQGKSLLVDTLFDLDLTRKMLRTITEKTDVDGNFDFLVNTHDNGDHCFGNQLVSAKERICSRSCAHHMQSDRAEQLQEILGKADQLGELGQYYIECFGKFDFQGIEVPLPTQVFEKSLSLELAGKKVELIEVGPAHTEGDTIVISDSIVYTGDIVFHDVTPILWAGPVSGWLQACETILSKKPSVVVPGHGPIGDTSCVRKVQDYLAHVYHESTLRHQAGMSVFDAAIDISLDGFRHWHDSERIVANVHAVYRELNKSTEAPSKLEIFELMAKVKKRI